MCQKFPCPSTAGCIQGWHDWRSNLEFLGCFLEASLNKYPFDGSVIWRTSYIRLVVYPTIYHGFRDYLFFVQEFLFFHQQVVPKSAAFLDNKIQRNDRPLPIFSGCSPTSYRCTVLASDKSTQETCDEISKHHLSLTPFRNSSISPLWKTLPLSPKDFPLPFGLIWIKLPSREQKLNTCQSINQIPCIARNFLHQHDINLGYPWTSKDLSGFGISAGHLTFHPIN